VKGKGEQLRVMVGITLENSDFVKKVHVCGGDDFHLALQEDYGWKYASWHHPWTLYAWLKIREKACFASFQGSTAFGAGS